METDDEKTQMRYAAALAEYADAGGYDIEVTWDVCTIAGLGVPYDRAKYRELRPCPAASRSGWCWSSCSAGPTRCCCSTSRTTSSTCPARSGSSSGSASPTKTILFISHDRELLNNTATRVVTVELGRRRATRVWTHPGGFASYHEARKDRFARFEELRRRWDEEHAKLKALVLRYKNKAEYNDGMAVAVPGGADPAAQVRGGRPADRAAARAAGQDAAQGRPHRQAGGGLRGPRADRADEAVRPRGLVRRAGGRARLQRLGQVALPAAAGAPAAATRTWSTSPSGDVPIEPVRHTGKAKLGARVRPGWFVQTHEHPELIGRTLLEILHRGDDHRDGMGREAAARVLDRYELAHAAEQRFESLSGGQQARFQILLLELSGATLLLLDEPTDNLDVQSAEALEDGPGGVRGHGAGGHPRPLVRPRLRPLPGVRRRRVGLRVRRPGLGRGPRAARPLTIGPSESGHARCRRRGPGPLGTS